MRWPEFGRVRVTTLDSARLCCHPARLIAVVSGDPTRPARSLSWFPCRTGTGSRRTAIPAYEHVEVKEGTLLVGAGDRLDPKMTQVLAAGDSATAPAGMHHFSIAKGRTLVSATFMGPYTITYLRAEDAPKPRSFRSATEAPVPYFKLVAWR